MNYNSAQTPGTATSAARQNHINEWAENLESVAKETEAIAAEVEQRFGPVLQPAPPASEKSMGASEPAAYLVPLADHMRRVTQGLDRANSLLRNVLHRAEI